MQKSTHCSCGCKPSLRWLPAGRSTWSPPCPVQPVCSLPPPCWSPPLLWYCSSEEGDVKACERLCSWCSWAIVRHSPDEDVDRLAVVGAEHNVGRTQKWLQDVDEPRRHRLHLVENENGASALRQVPLDPALQLLLQARRSLVLYRICVPLQNESPSLTLLTLNPCKSTHPVLVDELTWRKMQRGDKLVDVRAAHSPAVQMSSEHWANHRLSRPGRSMEGEHQGALGVFILKELGNLLGHDVLDQVLSVDIPVEVPLQIWSRRCKHTRKKLRFFSARSDPWKPNLTSPLKINTRHIDMYTQVRISTLNSGSPKNIDVIQMIFVALTMPCLDYESLAYQCRNGDANINVQ